MAKRKATKEEGKITAKSGELMVVFIEHFELNHK